MLSTQLDHYQARAVGASASGSGIPQTRGHCSGGFPSAGDASSSSGMRAAYFAIYSACRLAAVSIQIGAAASKAAGSRMSRNTIEENTLITGGAAAGLSAAFSAPLSGMMFALEEVHKSFSPSVLLTAVTASLSSISFQNTGSGLTPVAGFHPLARYRLHSTHGSSLGIVAGLIGALMNRILLGFQTLYSKIPAVVRPMIALAAMPRQYGAASPTVPRRRAPKPSNLLKQPRVAGDPVHTSGSQDTVYGDPATAAVFPAVSSCRSCRRCFIGKRFCACYGFWGIAGT